MNARSILVFTVLSAGALASWYLARQQPGESAAATTDERHRGYYLTAARILGTGEDGSLLYEIHADRAEQQDDEHIAFSGVSISYSPGSEVPWVVNADSAVLRSNERNVILQGHVRAISSEGFSDNDTEIRTQYLELDPENYLAQTDARVQIRIGPRSLTATGMLASLKDNQLQLKSNVNGKFLP